MSDDDLILDALARHRRLLAIVGPLFLVTGGVGVAVMLKASYAWPFGAFIVAFSLWKAIRYLGYWRAHLPTASVPRALLHEPQRITQVFRVRNSAGVVDDRGRGIWLKPRLEDGPRLSQILRARCTNLSEPEVSVARED